MRNAALGFKGKCQALVIWEAIAFPHSPIHPIPIQMQALSSCAVATTTMFSTNVGITMAKAVIKSASWRYGDSRVSHIGVGLKHTVASIPISHMAVGTTYDR